MGDEADGSTIVIEDEDGILAALGISSDGNGEINNANVARKYSNAVFSVNGVQVTRSTNRSTTSLKV